MTSGETEPTNFNRAEQEHSGTVYSSQIVIDALRESDLDEPEFGMTTLEYLQIIESLCQEGWEADVHLQDLASLDRLGLWANDNDTVKAAEEELRRQLEAVYRRDIRAELAPVNVFLDANPTIIKLDNPDGPVLKRVAVEWHVSDAPRSFCAKLQLVTDDPAVTLARGVDVYIDTLGLSTPERQAVLDYHQAMNDPAEPLL